MHMLPWWQDPSSYGSLLDGYSTLDHASTVWTEHQQHLNDLNEEIMRQQNTLHRMHMSERLLASRHEQIKQEIAKLMQASAEVSRQLEELKGQYSTQINDLKAQYHDLARALKKEKEAAQEELTKNIEEQVKSLLIRAANPQVRGLRRGGDGEEGACRPKFVLRLC